MQRPDTYASHLRSLRLRVRRRSAVACNQVQVKLLDVDVEDLLDSRIDALLGIFRRHLWPLEPAPEGRADHRRLLVHQGAAAQVASRRRRTAKAKRSKRGGDAPPVYLTSIQSTADAGLRLPLDPGQKQGLLLRVGSAAAYSEELLQLDRELQPSRQLRPCPSNYRSSAAEHLFRAKRFTVDWCHFQLLPSACGRPGSGQSPAVAENAERRLQVQRILNETKRFERYAVDDDRLSAYRRYRPLIALNLALVSLLSFVLIIALICASCN